jgi:hypothetical protein
VFDAIWNIKPRLFGLGGVANPRDSYGYRYGLRLAQIKNPSVLFVPSSIKHCTSLKFPRRQREFSFSINDLRWIAGLGF